MYKVVYRKRNEAGNWWKINEKKKYKINEKKKYILSTICIM